MNIPIVIPCYNRINSLKRLLQSLEQANYGNYKPLLIFSIDKSNNNDVADFISTYNWLHGEKLIYQHDHNIGLKENILFCGDLTPNYDGIILLEDDLVVSSAFYLYAIDAAQFYQNENNIAGISLYSYEYEELGEFRFYPFITEYDTYFMQWTSSWGQLWLKHHWTDFRTWYNKTDIININVPHQVKLWTNSWKKYYLAYMIETDKYFVYPFVSYTNEFGEIGEHYIEQIGVNTVNLYMGNSPKKKFQPFNLAIYLYDAFFELKPQIIELNSQKIKVELDLNGNKCFNEIKESYFISSYLYTQNHLRAFGSMLIPYELNIIQNQKGKSFFLYDKNTVAKQTKSISVEFIQTKRKVLNRKEMLFNLLRRFKEKYIYFQN
jgi:hypothetical protein